MNTIPNNVLRLFWDVDKTTVSVEKHYKYIIEKVAEYGDMAEINWVKNIFPKEKVWEVIKNSKVVTPKSANFIAFLYNFPKEEILCIQRPYTQKQNRFGN